MQVRPITTESRLASLLRTLQALLPVARSRWSQAMAHATSGQRMPEVVWQPAFGRDEEVTAVEPFLPMAELVRRSTAR